MADPLFNWWDNSRQESVQATDGIGSLRLLYRRCLTLSGVPHECTLRDHGDRRGGWEPVSTEEPFDWATQGDTRKYPVFLPYPAGGIIIVNQCRKCGGIFFFTASMQWLVYTLPEICGVCTEEPPDEQEQGVAQPSSTQRSDTEAT